ncbi:WIAG-tail domain, partial [Paenibacillus glucanolyticus]
SRHLAPDAFDNFTLNECSITGDKIAEATITGEHIAAGSLSGIQIADGSLTGTQIAEGSIDSRHLSPDVCSNFTIDEGSITGDKIAEASITGAHVADGTITGQQLAEGTITTEHLDFTPIRGIAGQPKLQQFGMTPFVFGADALTEVTVQFDEPFAGINYVIVGMSNNPGFQISLKSQRENSAVLEVIRQQNCNLAYGFMSWIAIGPSL